MSYVIIYEHSSLRIFHDDDRGGDIFRRKRLVPSPRVNDKKFDMRLYVSCVSVPLVRHDPRKSGTSFGVVRSDGPKTDEWRSV